MSSKFIPKFLLVPAVAAAAAVGLSVWSTAHTPLEASSHREAPLIADDPVADNTDLYAFKDPNDASKIVIIANYIPFELPQGGPNYSTFGENVRYEVHVKNDGTKAGDDVTYRFTFKRVNQDPTTFFNIRLGAQNLKTTYTCEKSTDGGATFTAIVSNGVVAPNNIGPRSINTPVVGLGQPSYTDLRQSTVTNATGAGGEQVFCGPADDPFFADLGAIFDLANLRPAGAPDGLSHKNCHSIALSIPIATLQKNGKAVSAATSILDGDYVIGVWASASRPAMQTFSASTGNGASGDYVQVSRLGMPLTNEVINPIGGKDRWNALTPYNEDAKTDDYLSNPELGLYVDQRLFGGAVPQLIPLTVQTKSLAGQPFLGASFPGFDFGNTQSGLFPLKGSAAVKGTALDDAAFGNYLLVANSPRSVDIKPIFHTGVPNLPPYQLATGKTQNNPLTPGKPFINNFLPLSANVSGNPGGDMLRLNMAVPATPRTVNGQPNPEFSNQGLLQAAVLGLTDSRFAGTGIQNIPNMDGFPNGRRLEDAVDQIELKAVGGLVLAAIGLWYDDFTPASTSPVTPRLVGELTFTTGVEKNDTTIRAAFPFVQTPWIGTGAASGPTDVLTIPNLTVSTAMPVEAGTYNNVTITGSGVAAFNGPIVVNGTLTVQTGGVLNTRGVLATNCIPVSGPGSFVLQPGATLRICDAAGIAATGATGSIQVNGTRTFAPDATYEYNGLDAQMTGTGLPSQVRSLTVNNGAGLTLNNGGVKVVQTLALTNGNLTTSTSQPLTLLSTPTAGTALVVNTNGAVTGPATMQRAIDPAFNPGPGYRHYSSPVASTTLDDLGTNTPGFTPIFNQAYNSAGASSGSVTPFPNVFGYDQARVTSAANATSAFDMGFVVPMGSDPMGVLSGYVVNIAPPAVVDLTGTLNNGPLVRTNLTRGTQPQSGWQLLGNPYPSPLDFSQPGGVTRNNVDDAIYVYQSTGQYVGQYRSYVNGVGNPQVAAMQGFFARVSAGQTTGSFALNNAARVTTFAATPSFNRGGTETRPLVNLKLQGAPLLLADETYVYFEQGATAGFDAHYDAYKLPSSSGLSLSSLLASDLLSVNGLPLLTGPTASTTVPLDVQVPATGSYTLNAASVLNFPAGTKVLLLDAQTGARIDLAQQPAYTFTAASLAMPGRFSLYFGPSAVLATTNAALAEQVQLYPNPAHGSFTLLLPAALGRTPVAATLYNQLGQVVARRTLPMTAAGATAQFDVSSLALGVYTLQLQSGDAKVTKRVMIER
ncbi:DUF4331 family protein [Hymenobacter caeli]|uniref:Secretion system C-terminal sorting domain-containing protein n=1 Tax=Hymenobacter caeli TaxID=2735894 RepID=A0ABX2FSB1_9BACT|nr:DUF4331 family protein [Hymenobacter caeli]NRT19386.1 hypothetical protein [Hymenobacter caeli]